MTSPVATPLPTIDPVVDPFGPAEARALALGTGPWVSITMPTPRSGPDTLVAAREFDRLLDQAEGLAGEHGQSLTAPLRSLVDDDFFWQQLADGLAVFSGPNGTATFRLSDQVAALPRCVRFGPAALTSLMPWLAADQRFHLIALSQGNTRVFAGSRDQLVELSLPDLPTSLDEMDEDRDHQQHLQWSPQGGGDRNVHGHAADSRADRVRAEKFVRRVIASARTLPQGVPLLLACVPENAALFRAAGGHPDLVESTVTGNADRMTPAELHRQVWPLVQEIAAEQVAAQSGDMLDLVGTGRVTEDVDQIAKAARQGQVETLYVAPAAGDSDSAVVLDEIISVTVANSGRVEHLDETVGVAARALLRW